MLPTMPPPPPLPPKKKAPSLQPSKAPKKNQAEAQALHEQNLLEELFSEVYLTALGFE